MGARVTRIKFNALSKRSLCGRPLEVTGCPGYRRNHDPLLELDGLEVESNCSICSAGSYCVGEGE